MQDLILIETGVQTLPRTLLCRCAIVRTKFSITQLDRSCFFLQLETIKRWRECVSLSQQTRNLRSVYFSLFDKKLYAKPTRRRIKGKHTPTLTYLNHCYSDGSASTSMIALSWLAVYKPTVPSAVCPADTVSTPHLRVSARFAGRPLWLTAQCYFRRQWSTRLLDPETGSHGGAFNSLKLCQYATDRDQTSHRHLRPYSPSSYRIGFLS